MRRMQATPIKQQGGIVHDPAHAIPGTSCDATVPAGDRTLQADPDGSAAPRSRPITSGGGALRPAQHGRGGGAERAMRLLAAADALVARVRQGVPERRVVQPVRCQTIAGCT